MRFDLTFAVKNLFRNLRRTVLSMVAIIAGVGVFILGQGFVGGISENIVRAQIDGVSGHAYARPAGYPTEGLSSPVDELLTLDEETRAWLDQNTVAWTTRLLFTPNAVKGADSLRVRAIGFDPARDAAVFPRDAWTVRGRIPTTAADGVLVSQGLAGLLDVAEGGRLVLQTRTSAGAMNALDVGVAGVVTTGNPMIDRMGVLVPMDLALDLVRPGERVSHVAVRLGHRDHAAAFSGRMLERLGPQAEIATWEDETRDLLALQEIRKKALNLLVLALMGMSAVGIANTILMAAYERVREIGTLQAMGMTRGGVLRLFVLEGAAMGIIGGLIGAALGGGTVAWYSREGIDLSAAIQDGAQADVPMSTMLYLAWSPTVVIVGVVFGVVVAVAASVYPARVASRMPPAEAVRAS